MTATFKPVVNCQKRQKRRPGLTLGIFTCKWLIVVSGQVTVLPDARAAEEGPPIKTHIDSKQRAIIDRAYDNLLKQKVHQDAISGMAVAVLQHGEPIFSRCYGFANLSRRVPVTPDTVFAIASLTKIFTATALIKLEKEHKLNLNESVCSRLKGFPRAWKDVSIRHLLSHTSGLPPETRTRRAWSGSFKELSARQRSFCAGEKWEYNNTGYIIAGKVIEAQCDLSLGEYFEKGIFGPAGMRDTYIPSELFPPDLATGYHLEKGHLVEYKNFQPWVLMGGSAGVISNLSDLIKFEQALNTSKILDERGRQLMFRSVLLTSGRPSGWCCGWESNSTPAGTVYRKNGNIGGYSCWYARGGKDDLTVIILSNTGQIKYDTTDANLRQLFRRWKRDRR